jgi:tetratricopeptide (TPR) repeat protein
MNRTCRVVLVATLLASFQSARAKDDKWVEAHSPNFIVVSDGSAQQARNTAIQFEQIRELFQQSLVAAKGLPTPVITILAAKDESTLRSLLPEYWETKGHAHPAGIFLDSVYQLQIAVLLSGEGDNPYESIYHEYYHSLTMPYFPGMPVWISEGMADLFGNSKIQGKTASLGVANPALIQLVRREPLIPLSVLFRVDHASPYYNESGKISIFYAESWALVHYLMVGDNGARRQQLVTYLDSLSHGASQDEAAAKAFGDLGRLQKQLESYVAGSTFYEFHTAAPGKIPENEVKVRNLSDAETAAYRGGFLALHRRFAEAEPLLKEASRTDPSLAPPWQGLAVLYFEQKQLPEERAALDAAIGLDPNNALTRFLRAQLETRGADSQLRESEIEADLRAAIAANANFAPPYSLLATRLAATGQRLPEAFELAKNAVELEPGVSAYQLVLAEVLARARRYDNAEEVANRLEASALDPAAKQNAAQLKNYIQDLKNADARRDQVQAAPNSARGGFNAATNSTEPKTTTQQPPVDDGKRRVEGAVTDVQCEAQEMVITVATSDGPVKLHSVDNTKIDFISDAPIKSESFWPCTALQGRNVKVKFFPSAKNSKESYLGEITNVEIRR